MLSLGVNKVKKYNALNQYRIIMPLYVLLTKLTEACKNQLREEPEILDEICNKLEACERSNFPQLATLGEYNFVNIIELENENEVYGLALELNSIQGIVTKVLPALPMSEYKKELYKMKK